MKEQPVQINNEEISLKELIQKIQEWFQYLKTQRKLIFVIAALGAIIGFLYASFQKPKYKATVSFVIEEEKNSGVSGALGIASSFGLDIGTSNGLFSTSNIFELIKSHLMVEKILLNEINVNGKNTNFANLYLSFNKIKSYNKSKMGIPLNRDKLNFNYDQNVLIQTIADMIIENNIEIIQKDKKINILYLTVTSENEFFSKYFCEELIKETSRFYIETKSKKAKINVEILQNQTDSVTNELNKAISGVAKYKDVVFNLNPALSNNLTPSLRKEIDVKTNTAILTQLITQLELSKVNLRKETPLFQIIDLPQFPLKFSLIGKLKAVFMFSTIATFLTSIFLIIYKSWNIYYKNNIS